MKIRICVAGAQITDAMPELVQHMSNQNLVITIGRQYGSGGRIIGHMLSEELGINFYDDEILKLASDESAIGEQYFRMSDEKAGTKLLYKIVGGLKNSLSKPSLDDDLTKPENLFKFQSEVIRKLAKEESCIIVGRCADYVLEAEEMENLIKIFVASDIPARVRRVMEVDGVDTKEALKRVNQINKDRTFYYKYYTGREWENVNNYDLTIDTSKVELEQAIELIKQYIRLRGVDLNSKNETL